MSDLNRDVDDFTLTAEKIDLQHPRLYKILLHNDDYTPMDFVVMVLESIFRKSHEDAVHIMLSVHQKGLGVCGTYTHEVAEHKTQAVNNMAKEQEYPLQCTMEPD